ncbi:GNAT family N-acetyltransferase [Candidatus Pacebacteria bacterium]|nr:GNAT family N-acetyltransferase [Candidatus Paceibacterota bacterium]
MELVELTSENIDQYLAECTKVQEHLRQSEEANDPMQIKATAAAVHSYFIALVSDERVAGLGVANKIVHPIRTNAYIDNVVVHPDFRGQSLFTVIMDALEAKAVEWGASQTKLTCSREPVQPLYERRGYRVKETNYYVKKL